MIAKFPDDISQHMPSGYEPKQGVWLVLPERDGQCDGIDTVNSWLRAEDWYPQQLQHIAWFGEDGVGNFFGWDPVAIEAILWNPEDGPDPSRRGDVKELWQFVLNGYK